MSDLEEAAEHGLQSITLDYSSNEQVAARLASAVTAPDAAGKGQSATGSGGASSPAHPRTGKPRLLAGAWPVKYCGSLSRFNITRWS